MCVYNIFLLFNHSAAGTVELFSTRRSQTRLASILLSTAFDPRPAEHLCRLVKEGSSVVIHHLCCRKARSRTLTGDSRAFFVSSQSKGDGPIKTARAWVSGGEVGEAPTARRGHQSTLAGCLGVPLLTTLRQQAAAGRSAPGLQDSNLAGRAPGRDSHPRNVHDIDEKSVREGTHAAQKLLKLQSTKYHADAKSWCRR
ncbi:hypothetical protein ABBQ38_011036 [Trebouxia sp. C0009 RCD-2024]